MVLITTAGDDQDSVCYEEYDYAKRVTAGVIEDETYLPVIFEAREEDDWRQPATWAKANPSIDVTVKRDYLEAECRAAVAEPRKQNAFKRLHLNVWTRQSEVWIPIEWWNACPALVPAALAGLQVGDIIVAFSGQPVVSAQDLIAKIASTSPMTSSGSAGFRPSNRCRNRSPHATPCIDHPPRPFLKNGHVKDPASDVFCLRISHGGESLVEVACHAVLRPQSGIAIRRKSSLKKLPANGNAELRMRGGKQAWPGLLGLRAQPAPRRHATLRRGSPRRHLNAATLNCLLPIR